MNIRHFSLASLGFALLAAGCGAPPPLLDAPIGAPPAFPIERYREAPDSASVYVIDAARSRLLVYAYRDGALKRMGHDHVIASHDLAGFVRQDPSGGAQVSFTGDLYLPLAGLTVDEPALREQAGFETEPSEEDRVGTRGNMQKSLEAAVYPFVSASLSTPGLSSSALASAITIETVITVELNLHGVVRQLTVPVTAELKAGTLTASGKFEVTQSDFGIQPFSVLGGALAVRDTVDVSFEIFADPAAKLLD